jgi:hypothetical protein
LHDIINFCDGKIQSTGELRELIKELHAEQIPTSWKKFNIANIKATEWITDFKKRLDQFSTIIPIKEYRNDSLIIY